MANHFDVMIIGGGTAGLRASIIAAKSGFTTALIEPGAIGGTCLNTGCIPTKALLHSAEVYREMNDCEELGLSCDASFDFSKVMGRMRDIVTTGRRHAEESVEKIDNITHYDGKARFVSRNAIEVNGEEVSADKIIIATGSSPWAPPIPGLKDTGYMTNVEALELEEVPDKLLIIGGGYIACEFATFFASLGVDITILEAQERILSMIDEDVTDLVHGSLESLGADIKTGMKITRVEGENGKKVTITAKEGEDGEEESYQADHLMVCTGRRPNTEGMALDKAEIKLDDRGNIEVNEFLETNQHHIYAIGDVNAKAPFAHAAKREARAALENALLDSDKKVMHDLVPWAVFTHPTIGGVGLTEEEAREQGHKIGVLKGKFSRVGKAKILMREEGFAKIIYDKKSRDVLGAVIVGPDAHNLIHEIVVLMNTPDPKVDYLKQAIHIHPTLAEVMEELKEA